MRLYGAVEVTFVEAAAADHGANVSADRIERDQRRLQHVVRLGRRRCIIAGLGPRSLP